MAAGVHRDWSVLREQQCDGHVSSHGLHREGPRALLLQALGCGSSARLAQNPVLGRRWALNTDKTRQNWWELKRSFLVNVIGKGKQQINKKRKSSSEAAVCSAMSNLFLDQLDWCCSVDRDEYTYIWGHGISLQQVWVQRLMAYIRCGTQWLEATGVGTESLTFGDVWWLYSDVKKLADIFRIKIPLSEKCILLVVT